MSPERWLRLQELFAHASELDETARSAWLAQECADDPALREEVESLVAHEHDATLGGIVDAALEKTPPALVGVGQHVGPYRLTEEIGAGGMGRVFRAVRDDAEYSQEVAVKMLRIGLMSADLVRRFRTERQILARLNHPHLARLLDGGTTPSGEPYIVMEYVTGLPITDHCFDKSVSTRDRLQLFRSVCLAVHYAHQNLIVHRDIKPSNVLVAEDGTPRLLDFGIAKLLRSDDADPTLALTQKDARLLTPEYASPEQVRGEPVTTAADIYSLGVVLYELLAGQTPFAVDGKTPFDLPRRILEDDPERPSAVSRRARGGDRGRTAPQPVDPELDTIVAKALHKEPQRRYASAEQLAEDVNRYLAGQPLLARPDSVRYRLSKFVRRHRLGVGTAAGIVVLLLAFGAAMAVLASRLRDERNRAQTEAETARQVTGFLVDLFRISDPSETRGNAITAREVLDLGAQRVRGELRQQPQVQAALMATMGDVYQGLGLYKVARPLLEESLTTRRRELGEDHPITLEGLATLVELLRRTSDFKTAEVEGRRVLEARRRVLGPEHPAVGDSLQELAVVLQALGRLDDAEKTAREALAIRRRVLPAGKPEVASTLATLGGIVRAKGDLVAAEPLYREALALQREAREQDHPDVVGAMHALGGFLNAKGDYAEAEQLFREVVERRRRMYAGPHPALSASLNNLASLLHDLGRLDEAEPIYRESLVVYEAVSKDHYDMAIRLNNLASLLEDRGALADAEPLYRRALEIRVARLGPEHAAVATGLQNLGRLLVLRGRIGEGEPLLRQALAMRRKLQGAEDPALASTLGSLCEALRYKRAFTEAEALCREGLELRQRKLKPGHPQIAQMAVYLGAVLIDDGRAREAEPLLRDALGSVEKSLRAGHPSRARAQVMLARSLIALGRLEEARPLLLDGHAVLAHWPGPTHPYALEASRALQRIGGAGRASSSAGS